MQDTIEKLERRRLTEIARDYRNRGYEVIVGPQSADLPEFLAGFDLDLIARNDQEQVIVEVRSSTTLPQSTYLPKLAEAVSNHPDWRLDLVVTNPKEKPLAHQGLVLPGREEVLRRVADAMTLYDRGSDEAALLLAWSATEAALRLIAREEGIELTNDSPSFIVNQLLFEGILTKKDQEILRQAIRLRNELIHGFRPSRPTAGFVKKLVGMPERILRLSDRALAAEPPCPAPEVQTI